MFVSARTYLATGVAALTAGAIVAAPIMTSLPEELASREVRLSAAQTPTPEFRALVEAAQQQVLALPAPPSDPLAPVALNATGDRIVNAWNAAVPWIDYGVNLATYALQFVPFGYLAADQLNIFYDSLFPIANSFVLDLVAPVVNDPLNAAVWANGIGDVASTTVNSFVNLGISEFNYFFGWLIPPIPPIGPLALEANTAGMSTDSIGAMRQELTDAGERLTDAVEQMTGLHPVAVAEPAAASSVKTQDEDVPAVKSADETEAQPVEEDVVKSTDREQPEATAEPADDQKADKAATPARHDIATQMRDGVRKATDDTRKTLDGIGKSFSAPKMAKPAKAERADTNSENTSVPKKAKGSKDKAA